MTDTLEFFKVEKVFAENKNDAFQRMGSKGERRYGVNISIERKNEVTTVVAGGRLDVMGAPEIEASCKKLISEGTQRLLLDMASVEYISSAGLRSLLVLAKAMKASGGTLVLCSLTAAVREVMEISGFDNILSLAADRSAAMVLLT